MADGPSTHDGPASLKPAWKALGALCVGFFMILLDQSIVSVATPAIQQSLRADYGQALWVHSVYLLTFAVFLLVMGRLGDRYGPRRVYLIGLMLFTGASLICGLAPTIHTLIGGRALQGLGGAMMAPQTMVVISRVFPKNKRGAALGVWGAIGGLSNLAGPLVGGLITSLASWQWIFLLNVPLGLITAALVLRWVPVLGTVASRIDGWSVALSIASVSCVVFTLQQRAYPWLFIAGLVLCGVFILRQTRAGDRALVPVDLFTRRHFSFGNASMFTMGFAIAGMMVPVMMYLQDVQGFGPLAAAGLVMPMSLIATILAPYVGSLVDRTAPRPVSMAGFALMIAGVSALVVSLRPGVSVWWVVVAMAVLGFGNAFVWAPNSTLTLRELPAEVAGAGSGMYNFTRQLGAVAGTAVLAAVLQTRVAHGSQAAFGESLLPAALLLIVGLWAAWMARDK